MRRMIFAVIGLGLMLGTAVAGSESASAPDLHWPQWRGPNANGFAADANPPVEWSETKNVKWKLAIPGTGASTPIVLGDRLYVTTAIPKSAPLTVDAQAGQQRGRLSTPPAGVMEFAVIAVDRHTGTVVWKKAVREELPHEGTHPTGTWASNSAVTDGEHIYAYFGSRGLYALDLDGNVVWERDFGDMKTKMSFGEGSSPTLFDDRLVIVWDHEGPSFVAALDKHTGKDIWKVERDETTSWATPYIVETGGVRQVITSATSRIRSYDLRDGRLIWEAEGMTANVIPSPVILDGTAILMSGFRGNSLLAVRLEGAEGNITGSESIVWSLGRDTPYTPSPLLYGETLYFLKSNNGVLSSFNAKTGEAYFGPERLDGVGTVYASPVGAAGRVYICDREGTTVVLEHGREFKLLATNRLDDGFDASPVAVGEDLYLRGRQNLYCISGND